MAQKLCQRIAHLNLGRRVNRRVMTLRRLIRKVLSQICICSTGKPGHYRVLLPYSSIPAPVEVKTVTSEPELGTVTPMICRDLPADMDLVSLKIGLMGDRDVGKTSFSVKYVGEEKEGSSPMMMEGINLMDKIQMVSGARISYSIWEVEGDDRSGHDRIPNVCKDAVAILFMFDLTSRCTLNSIISWYQEARKWNTTAIPIIVGTKFDEFIQLPIDLQWTIASQARAYAKALNATLFFSSVTYNINVNKIFKFITAKLFDLPWTVERNLTVGEPIIDF